MERGDGMAMKGIGLLAVLTIFCAGNGAAQVTRRAVEPQLEQQLQSPGLVADQLRHFMLTHVPELPPATAIQVDYRNRWVERRIHELLAAGTVKTEDEARAALRASAPLS